MYKKGRRKVDIFLTVFIPVTVIFASSLIPGVKQILTEGSYITIITACFGFLVGGNIGEHFANGKEK